MERCAAALSERVPGNRRGQNADADDRRAANGTAGDCDRPGELGVPAANSPEAVMVPMPPLTDQVKAGCVASATPNWSRAVAANCFWPFGAMVAPEGLIAMLVNV